MDLSGVFAGKLQQVFALKVLSFVTPWRYPGQQIHPPSDWTGSRGLSKYYSSGSVRSTNFSSSRHFPAEIQPSPHSPHNATDGMRRQSLS
jgi:hypothetical protein